MAPSLSKAARSSFAANFRKKPLTRKHRRCLAARSERFAHACRLLRRARVLPAAAPIVTIDAQSLQTTAALRLHALRGVVAVNCDGDPGFARRCELRGVEAFAGTLEEYCSMRVSSNKLAPLAVYADAMFAKDKYVLELLQRAMSTGAVCIQLTIIRRVTHGLVEKVFQAVAHCAHLHAYEPLGGWAQLSKAVLHNERAFVVMLLRSGLPSSLHTSILALPRAGPFQLSGRQAPRGRAASPPTLACVRELIRLCGAGPSVDFKASQWRSVRKALALLSPRQQRRALPLLSRVPGGLANFRVWRETWLVGRKDSRQCLTLPEFAEAGALHWARLGARLPPRTLVEFPGSRVPEVLEALGPCCAELLVTGVAAGELGPGRKAAMTKGQLRPEIVQRLDETRDPRYSGHFGALLVVAVEAGGDTAAYLQARLAALLPRVAGGGGVIGWAACLVGGSPLLLFVHMTEWMAERGFQLAMRGPAAWPGDDRSSWISELYERS